MVDLTPEMNPTYATDVPSVRHSPFSVGAAVLARVLDFSAFEIQHCLAVFNLVLVLMSIWCVLAVFGESAAGPVLLCTILFAYGDPPGHANSLALSDLPWHMVNPSAFAVSLCFFCWALLAKWTSTCMIPTVLTSGLLLGVATLCHAPTGALGCLGAALVCVFGASIGFKRSIATLALMAVIVLAGCLMWPMWSFIDAVRGGDTDFWGRPGLVIVTITRWTLLPTLGVLFALPYRDRPLVKVALVGAAGVYFAGVVGLIHPSIVLERLPLAGLIFAQIAIAIAITRAGLLNPTRWREIGRHLADRDSHRAQAISAMLIVLVLLAYSAVVQSWMILREPHLMRPYVATMMGKEDKQPNIRQTYEQLLLGVAETDVVLADRRTAWPIPSFRGRIVSAIHHEVFVRDETQRAQDVATFFDAGDRALDVVGRYNVRWIVLSETQQSYSVRKALLVPEAVVNRSRGLLLMDAKIWRDRYEPVILPPEDKSD